MIDPTLFVAGVLAIIATIDHGCHKNLGTWVFCLLTRVWLLYVVWRGLL